MGVHNIRQELNVGNSPGGNYLRIDEDGHLHFVKNGVSNHVQWDSDDKTLSITTGLGNVVQVGQEVFGVGVNKTGAQVDNGKVVYMSGVQGNRPTIDYADASDINKCQMVGVVTADISNNQEGPVTTFGVVRGFDTSGWSEGTKLYLKTDGSGDLTDTAPDTANNHMIWVGTTLNSTNNGSLFVNPIHEPHVRIPITMSMYDAQPARASETNWNGGILSLATGQPLDSVPTNIVVTKGIGKIIVVVNAGSDFDGTITLTGETIDRNTGASTPADTDTITVDALTTDDSATDSNGNTKHSFTGAYITSKWFTGSVTLSTTNLTLTDVDVYHVSFEQVNDSPDLTLDTFDVNLYTTNAAAEFDAYLFSIEKESGSKCDVTLEAQLHVGADGETAIANKYWRLRRGNLAKALDGTTDGIWVDIHYSNSPAYVEDVTAKVWLTRRISSL